MTQDQSVNSSNPALHPGIRLDCAEIRIIHLPLITPFVISTGTMTTKTFPLLVLNGEGLQGFSEGVMDPAPDYLEETIAGAMAFIKDQLLPSILGKRFYTPYELEPYLARWRGNQMAKAMVEMAFWDLWAKSLNVPLKTVIGGTSDQVDVGVSLGIACIDTTLARIAEATDDGYKRIKLKIARGHDLQLLQVVRKHYPHATLTVDANTSYCRSDTAHLQCMDEFKLKYIEQPFAYDDIRDHAQLQRIMTTDICLDESIRSSSHARKALEQHAARVINIKVGRVGGYMSARSIHDICAAFDVPVWCGGMLESGIGRAHNIHLSTLANFTMPGDTSSASRYFKRDIINQPLEATKGLMTVPTDGAGIGVTLDYHFLDSVSERVERIVPA